MTTVECRGDSPRTTIRSLGADPRESDAPTRDPAATLDRVADDLHALWTDALALGDFAEVTRLVEASHAVHRAVVALRSDNVIR